MGKRNEKGLDKVASAQLMFNEGWSQQNIAKVLRVHETTVSRWAKDGNWREKRAKSGVVETTAQEALWELINYQLDCLRSMTKEWKASNANRLIDKGDIDALQKMFVAVKGKQQKWTDYVRVLREFMEELQSKDGKLAKQLIEHVDGFLNDVRAKL